MPGGIDPEDQAIIELGRVLSRELGEKIQENQIRRAKQSRNLAPNPFYTEETEIETNESEQKDSYNNYEESYETKVEHTPAPTSRYETEVEHDPAPVPRQEHARAPARVNRRRTHSPHYARANRRQQEPYDSYRPKYPQRSDGSDRADRDHQRQPRDRQDGPRSLFQRIDSNIRSR